MNAIATLTDPQLNRHCFACETTYRVRQDGCTDPLAMMDCGHYYCRQCILDTDECHLCGFVTQNKFYVRRNQVWNVAPVIRKCIIPNTKLLSLDLICLLVRFNNLTTTNYIAYQCCVIDPPTRKTPHAVMCPWVQVQQQPFNFVPSLPQQSQYKPLFNVVLPLPQQLTFTAVPQQSTSTAVQKVCKCVNDCLCVVPYNGNRSGNTNNRRVNSGRVTKRAAAASASSMQLIATQMMQRIMSATKEFSGLYLNNNKSLPTPTTNNNTPIVIDDDDDECVDTVKQCISTTTITSITTVNDSGINNISNCIKTNTYSLSRMQSVSIDTKICVENFLALHPDYDTRKLYQFMFDKFYDTPLTNNIMYDMYVVLLLFDVKPLCYNIDSQLKAFIDFVKDTGNTMQYHLKFISSMSCDDVMENTKCVDITNLCDDDN
ncbi:Clas21 [Clostera anastomosis granulovirus B]|uniref:Clas21 n=2 Tax=Betabaculovirus TaxID=558017 RepID=A0A0K0WS38_9BBAC|nr:Clas21 [Clostera anastomosis granulovirus B]ACJ24347.1 hypothetical protein [Andraca bipunctata granulovirus]AKS25364.1 Clas21 [Clostera anastomosis granulovirus B]